MMTKIVEQHHEHLLNEYDKKVNGSNDVQSILTEIQENMEQALIEFVAELVPDELKEKFEDVSVHVSL